MTVETNHLCDIILFVISFRDVLKNNKNIIFFQKLEYVP